MKRLMVVVLAVMVLAVLIVQPALGAYDYVEGAEERTTADGSLEQKLPVNVPEYPRVEIIKVYSLRSGPGTNHKRIGRSEVGTIYRVWEVEGDWLKVAPPRKEKEQWIHHGGVEQIDNGTHVEKQWVKVNKPEPPPGLIDKAKDNWIWLVIGGILVWIIFAYTRGRIKTKRDREARKHRREAN